MNSPAWSTISLAGFLAAVGWVSVAAAQTAPAPTAPATALAAQSAPTTNAASKKPTVDQLFAVCKPVKFEFTDATLPTVLDYISKSFDVEVINKYEKELDDHLTLISAEPQTPRQAINAVNGTLMSRGYTLLESVRGEPPRVTLTVAPTNVAPGKVIQYFYGNNPDVIPEDGDLRTQVFTFKDVDPTKAGDMIQSVCQHGQVTVNPSAKTIIVTDTGMHVHAAASVLQGLEKQAAAEKKP